MKLLSFTSDELVRRLLAISKERNLYLLDSCNKGRYLIASFNPVSLLDIESQSAKRVLSQMEKLLRISSFAFVVTVSYEFGLKLNRISQRIKPVSSRLEPDLSVAIFDFLIVHDYLSQETFLIGNRKVYDLVEKELESVAPRDFPEPTNVRVYSDFERAEYENAVEQVKEFICQGETYQVNLTRSVVVKANENLSSERIFWNIRQKHPVPFACLLRRRKDEIVSASPERFFRIQGRHIFSSPIKGTRRRGNSESEDRQLKAELLNSDKDRAENVMIVDLIRNDLGRICEFGSVKVERLCEVEEYNTLFQMVSTVSGKLREDVSFSDVLRAVFPCGSITGAPKVRTMQIIDLLEKSNRGVSMGAIGYHVNPEFAEGLFGNETVLDFSVAIRTMNVIGKIATFKVGGGIVIDSEPAVEYEETVTKSKALIDAIGFHYFSENC